MRSAAILLLLLVVPWSHARANDQGAPCRSVVRLTSHGASAVVIATGDNRSLLLSCAHAFEGASLTRPIVVDAPYPAAGAPRRVGVRLLAVDHGADLSLIEIGAGPLPHVSPVAPAGTAHPRLLVSVGFDGMRDRPTISRATVLYSSPLLTWTKEKPWHGRSGGGLIDVQTGFCWGIVQGYEVVGAQRGLYASHTAILSFLRTAAAPVREEGH